MTTFNRITTSIEFAGPVEGYRIRIRYWSCDHQEFKEELSTRRFWSADAAERVAVRVAHDLRERLG